MLAKSNAYCMPRAPVICGYGFIQVAYLNVLLWNGIIIIIENAEEWSVFQSPALWCMISWKGFVLSVPELPRTGVGECVLMSFVFNLYCVYGSTEEWQQLMRGNIVICGSAYW